MLAARISGRAGLRARTLALIACSLSTILPLPLLAQPSPDIVAVSGVVRDATERPVPGVFVEALVAGRRITAATTAGDGRYELTVPRGVRYALRARRAGFAEYIAEVAGHLQPAVHDVVLQVGAVSDTLVVTASGGAAARATVASPVSVLTAAEIDALGAASLADVLRFVPALSVEGNGREGSLTSLFARGGNSGYNLVLIDGVRVNQNGGAFDVSRIAAAEIDRIEVVRGAQSALWGSDAIGSVVQVFTRRAGTTDAPQVTGSVQGGTFGTRRGDLRVIGGTGGRFDYYAGVTHRGTEGAFRARLPEPDLFRQTTIDAGAGATLGRRASLRTGIRLSEADGRLVGPIGYGARNTGSSYDTTDLIWHLSSTHAIGSRFTGTAAATYFRYRGLSEDTVADPPYATYAVLAGTPDAMFPGGVRLVRTLDQPSFEALVQGGALPAPGQFLASALTFDFSPFEDLTRFHRPAVRYQGDVTWGAGNRLSAGYEWERESNLQAPAERADTNAFFVQQEARLGDRVFVTAGARADVKDAYGTYVSPKLSASGIVVPARAGVVTSLRVFGNIGRGIKAPLFSERFGAPWADPNPDLAVERARTADLGVEATFLDQHVRASVTWFHNRYRDQIAYRPGAVGDGLPDFININGAEAHGMEIEVLLQRPVAGVTAAGTYALVDTEVVTNLNAGPQYRPGQPLLRRPTHAGSLRATWLRGRASVHGDLRLVGARHDSGFLFLLTVPNAARPESVSTDITVNPGYAVAGAGLDLRVHEALMLFVRADNIGNAAYEHALGYPGLPRSAMAGLRFALGAPAR